MSSMGFQLDETKFDEIIMETGIECELCPEEEGYGRVNAMNEWCDVQSVLACETKGLELQKKYRENLENH